MLVLKPYHFNYFVHIKSAETTHVSRGSSESFRTGIQNRAIFMLRLFDMQSCLSRLAGWLACFFLFIYLRIDNFFYVNVLSKKLKLQPFQINKKLKHEPSDIKSVSCTLPNKRLTEQCLQKLTTIRGW